MLPLFLLILVAIFYFSWRKEKWTDLPLKMQKADKQHDHQMKYLTGYPPRTYEFPKAEVDFTRQCCLPVKSNPKSSIYEEGPYCEGEQYAPYWEV